ncbi:MAG: hypothetical protein QXQ91_03225 [Nanopusillaceae archaeon]
MIKSFIFQFFALYSSDPLFSVLSESSVNTLLFPNSETNLGVRKHWFHAVFKNDESASSTLGHREQEFSLITVKKENLDVK